MDIAAELQQMGQQAKAAARVLNRLTTAQKNQALQALAAQLRAHQQSILAANALDMADAQAQGLSATLQDRLRLDPQRLEAMAADVEQVGTLDDPVGTLLENKTLPNGLHVQRRRVPLGVVGVIYEARPNVTSDVAALCLKAGNAVILRGGKETVRSNVAVHQALQQALLSCDIPPQAIQLIAAPEREWVAQLLRLDRYVDMIIPRGGAGLHDFCREHATIPVITGGIGVCHLFVDDSADLGKTVPVIYNAKVQRPTVCNALDTVLIHRTQLTALVPLLAESLAAVPVEIRADAESYPFFQSVGYPLLTQAQPEDWGQEFLALVLSVRVVTDLDEALAHIAEYSSGHSESILTETPDHGERFLQEVDSAVVYINASTRFTDGGQLGLGAEVAVSTQKLHARGPMALEGLTSYKWLVRGNGQVRP